MSNPIRLLPFLVALVTFVGCGGSATDSASDQGAGTTTEGVAETTTAEEAPPDEPEEINVGFDGPYEARRDRVTLRGDVNFNNVKVRINGARASVEGQKWSKVVTLKKNGDNEFDVIATRQGFVKDATTAVVTRKLSAAEKAARREAKKQAFIAQATTIPYNQLEKNADAHKGKKVVYRGQIFQIQEDSYGGGVMLISVTDEGYGFWTDNIWVDYDGNVKGAEDDIITVYGTVQGSESYETQIGGETYVPKIKARYVVE